jgi:hypothetical protein
LIKYFSQFLIYNIKIMKKLILLILFLIFVLFGCGPSAMEQQVMMQDTIAQTQTEVDTARIIPVYPEIVYGNVTTTEDTSGLQTTQIEEIKSTPDYGDINYAMSDSMAVNKTEEIALTVSKGLSREEVLSKVNYLQENVSSVKTQSIRISPLMSVDLIDPSGENFRIIPITPKEQFLENNQITFWKWNVTPLKPGNNPLTLSVNIIIDDKTKNIQVYEDSIYVYSTDTWWDKFVGFFKNNWQYLFSTLLIPVGIYLYRLIFRKKKT